MGLETHSIVEIRERFHKIGKDTPTMHWSHGVLWIDTNDKNDLDEIKDVMEAEVLSPGLDLIILMDYLKIIMVYFLSLLQLIMLGLIELRLGDE